MEGIHQPGLAFGGSPHKGEAAFIPLLAGILCVLHVQLAYLLLAEIAKAQRFSLDVECRAAGYDVLVREHDAVVAHIAHTAEDNALGESHGAIGVARAYLSQHAYERVAHQGIYLVDDEDKRLAHLHRQPLQE